VLTIRSFLAKFTRSGYFFVFEPRPVFDFANDITDVVLSPIVGKALGAGFNVLALAEFPTTSKAREPLSNRPPEGLLGELWLQPTSVQPVPRRSFPTGSRAA
jgi:hypothetical protein